MGIFTMMLFCSTYELSISTGNVFFFVKIKPLSIFNVNVVKFNKMFMMSLQYLTSSGRKEN